MKSRMALSMLSVLTVTCLALAIGAEEPKPAPTPKEDETQPAKIEMNDLEKQFEKAMTGAALVGRFSTDGKEDKLPTEERYEIVKVTKLSKDLWMFTAKIGKGNVAIPMPLPVKWAGDTPIISVTKMKFPGMGTYTARVLIYGGRYAGTWDAGDHGGSLWGKIERAEAPSK